MHQEVEELTVIGGTVRIGYRNQPYPAVHAVLLIGDTLASHYWLNIVATSGDVRLRHFITEDDFRALGPAIHVRPQLAPCFLVVCDGFIVDWFPAPLPTTQGIQDPSSLLSSVLEHLTAYD
jgi:hypothetical protein